MSPLLMILIALVLAFILSEIFKMLGLPRVVGQITAGIILGIGSIKMVVFSVENYEVLTFLANLGVILLFYYLGLELDLRSFAKHIKRSVTISLFKALTPLIAGFLIMKYALGFNALSSLMIGLALSAGAQSVSIDLLEELKMLKSKIGTMIVRVGVITDMFEIFIVAIILALFQMTVKQLTITTLALNILAFFVCIFFARIWFIPHFFRFLGPKSSTARFMGAMIVVLLIVALSDFFGLGTLIGAIVAGILMRRSIYKDAKIPNWEEHDIARSIHIISFGFLIPLFFVWVGLMTDITLITQHYFYVILFVIIVLLFGVGGTLLGVLLSKGKFKEGIILGFGLTPKGDIGFVIGALAFEAGIISEQIFTSLILMALIVTIISPIIFNKLVLKYVKKRASRH